MLLKNVGYQRGARTVFVARSLTGEGWGMQESAGKHEHLYHGARRGPSSSASTTCAPDAERWSVTCVSALTNQLFQRASQPTIVADVYRITRQLEETDRAPEV